MKNIFKKLFTGGEETGNSTGSTGGGGVEGAQQQQHTSSGESKENTNSVNTRTEVTATTATTPIVTPEESNKQQALPPPPSQLSSSRENVVIVADANEKEQQNGATTPLTTTIAVVEDSQQSEHKPSENQNTTSSSNTTVDTTPPPPPPPQPSHEQENNKNTPVPISISSSKSTTNLEASLNGKSPSPNRDNSIKDSNNTGGGGFLSKLKMKFKGTKESAGDKKQFKASTTSDNQQKGADPSTPQQHSPQPQHVPLHMQDEKVEREIIYIKDLPDLPEDCQKLMRISGIPEEKFRQNLQTLLYVLHFRTGKILKLADEPPREPRKKFSSDRFNDGESLLEHIDPHMLKKLYKDVDQVGKGGFGTVYFAKSTRDKKTVAIKKMPHQTKRQQIQNFREASILSKCNHANIVKLITCHIDKDQNLWLIMEFMEGGTFEEAAKAWRFNENNLAYVARELLKGLQYLHENGMVHRDLKSANIMMSVEGKVKLIDFGLCEDVSSGSPCHMVGSPFWMPPEMIHQKPHSTPVDIWSFAISLLEMANQRPPMMESAVKAMFTVATEGATGFDQPELWSDCFKDFLSLCLKGEPSERATANDLLQHPFIKKADTRDNMENILKKIFLTNSLMNSGF